MSCAILHLDMDAFYPAVEALDDPALRGRPVIVGGSLRRGVVSSASYEARALGVYSSQPMAAALRACPHAVVLPVRMARYREISNIVFEIFHRVHTNEPQVVIHSIVLPYRKKNDSFEGSSRSESMCATIHEWAICFDGMD